MSFGADFIADWGNAQAPSATSAQPSPNITTNIKVAGRNQPQLRAPLIFAKRPSGDVPKLSGALSLEEDLSCADVSMYALEGRAWHMGEQKIQEVIMQRLVKGILVLNQPEQYNSTRGRLYKHFLFQLLSDQNLGDDDPVLELIAKELPGINIKTLRKCARERKEHGLGYFPEPAEQRPTVSQTLVPV